MRYLTAQEVIAINYYLIDHYSPGESKGVKDAGLLESAIYRPKQTLMEQDAYPNVFEKAAAFFESIAKNDCFQNGNKRTAFVSLIQFLGYNGFAFDMDEQKAEDFVVDGVLHNYRFDEIVEIIRNHSFDK